VWKTWPSRDLRTARAAEREPAKQGRPKHGQVRVADARAYSLAAASSSASALVRAASSSAYSAPSIAASA
jgi:hypothetical protein